MTKRNNRFFGKELSLEELSFEDLKHVAGGEGDTGTGTGETPPPPPPPPGG